MKTIAIFNNKGGVGKTSFCANIAAYYAINLNKRVLVIDLDPQANITHYMLGEDKSSEVIAPYYDSSLEKKHSTIVDAFEKYNLGESSVNTDLEEIFCDRFNASIIAGNPFLATYDDILSKKWNELSDPDNVSGIRVSNWIHTLISSKKEDFDYVFLDLSPSLGAINRTALLAADYFISPMSCDIFSLIAVKNIKHWFDKWIKYYDSKIGEFQKEKEQIWQIISKEIKEKVTINNGFLGYTVQSYISRKDSEGNVRTTHSYKKILDNFNPEISQNLFSFRNSAILSEEQLNLGEIPHMFSILALSQYVGAPISQLNAADGIAGSQYVQAKNYNIAFEKITKRINENLGVVND